jgi:hypothetical protein
MRLAMELDQMTQRLDSSYGLILLEEAEVSRNPDIKGQDIVII